MSAPGDGATPDAVFEMLGRVLADDRPMAWAEFDADGRVTRSGGVLGALGFGALSLPGAHVDDVGELLGLLPLDGPALHLPMLQPADAPPVDLYLVQREPGHALVVLPCADAVASRTDHQQRLNDSALRARADSRMLDRFVGGELVRQRLRDAPLAGVLEPATVELTVLFADVRGFTPFCEAREASEVCTVLNGFLAAMIEAVTAHGGFVDKVIGDAVMAIFGLAGDHADPGAPAIAALDAGRAMIAAVETLLGDNESWGVDGVGVGIATGAMAVGVLGTNRRRAFTAVGHRVNLAARLESGAAAGEIVVDEATWVALGERGRAFRRASRRLKGVSESVPVYSASLNHSL